MPLELENITNARVIESRNIVDILKHIDTPQTMVLFDIDNTLAEPQSGLTSQEWCTHMVKQKIREGSSKDQAEQEVVHYFRSLQPHISLKPVEQTTALLVKHLHEIKVPTFALTSRSALIAQRTIEQLTAIDLIFKPLAHHVSPFISKSPLTYIYDSGIIFCGSDNKGHVLVDFLEEFAYSPPKILVVDDTLAHLNDIEIALNKRVPFVGFYYTICAAEKRFKLEEAEKHWHALKQYCLKDSPRLKS